MSSRALLLSTLLLGYPQEGRSEEKPGRVFAGSLAFHGALRGANVASTRWSLSHGAVESVPWMRTNMEGKQAGVALALALTETKLRRRHRWVLRTVHFAATGIYIAKDLRAGAQARSYHADRTGRDR